MKIILFLVVLAAIVVLAFLYYKKPTPQPSSVQVSSLSLSSPAFVNNQIMPAEYTCDGPAQNPPLEISGVPAEAKSLALTIFDPDASASGFVHWVIYDIDPTTAQIRENNLPTGSVQGLNGTGKPGYVGPCPPSDTHHYIFTLYALDTKLNPVSPLDKAGLEKAIEGHVLANSQLISLYSRTK